MNRNTTVPIRGQLVLADAESDDAAVAEGAPAHAPAPGVRVAETDTAWLDAPWRHSRSGLMLPRGTVVSYQGTADELVALELESERRGVRAGASEARRVKRSTRDERQLHALCKWLSDLNLDTIGSVTFSDDYAKGHGVYSLARALSDVYQGLHEVSMNRGKIHGYRGRYVLAGEWHPSGRSIPHVHLALDSMGVHDHERLCRELWDYFAHTRGRSRFEPMRDADEATLYGLKDTMKASERDPDCIVFKLNRHHSLRRSA